MPDLHQRFDQLADGIGASDDAFARTMERVRERSRHRQMIAGGTGILACALSLAIVAWAFGGGGEHGGGEEVRLTPGSRVTFLLDPSDPSLGSIAITAPDGSIVRRLAAVHDGNISGGMQWSSDGRWLALAADDRDPRIFVVRRDGSDLHLLAPDGPRNQTDPAWSPDGERVAFDADGVIHIVNADGSDDRVVAEPGVASVSGLDWSPNGARLVFSGVAPTDERRSAIYTIGSDGSWLRDLTRERFLRAVEPAWSPDQGRIAFVGSTAEDPAATDLYVMHNDGSDIRRLSENGAAHAPSWSPDAKQLAYACGSSPDGANLCFINANGTGFRKVATSDGMPAWGPFLPS